MPKTQIPSPSRPTKAAKAPDFQWACSAHVTGKLFIKSEKIFFRTSEGSIFPVGSIGRDANSILWLFTHHEQCFAKDHEWLVYPQTVGKGRQQQLTPVSIAQGDHQDPKLIDRMTFTATVHKDYDGSGQVLPIFVGRNNMDMKFRRNGFSVVDLEIPGNYADMPTLDSTCQIKGQALRKANGWLLDSVEIVGRQSPKKKKKRIITKRAA